MRRFGPDGSKIVFSGDNGLYLMNADGTGRKQITFSYGAFFLVWTAH